MGNGWLLVRRRESMASETPSAGWSLIGRVLFRFAFAYMLIFNLFGGNSLLRLLWDPIVLWLGDVVFGVTITVRQLGSGDTTWNYVQLFGFVILASFATAVWSLLDGKRPHYERLHEWLRVIVRYSLAMSMILYGIAKL